MHAQVIHLPGFVNRRQCLFTVEPSLAALSVAIQTLELNKALTSTESANLMFEVEHTISFISYIISNFYFICLKIADNKSVASFCGNTEKKTRQAGINIYNHNTILRFPFYF